LLNENCISEKNIEDDITDWQTYRNEEYRFEVKYPDEWIVENNFLYSPEMYNAREGGLYSLQYLSLENTLIQIPPEQVHFSLLYR